MNLKYQLFPFIGFFAKHFQTPFECLIEDIICNQEWLNNKCDRRKALEPDNVKVTQEQI